MLLGLAKEVIQLGRLPYCPGEKELEKIQL